jgi:ATP-dependent exoDNAse (exonuclease V) alpha subunit
MSRFVESLRLKELAEEDIYFARRDQELIEALHKKRLAEAVAAATPEEKKLARTFEKHYRKINRCCQMKPLKLIRALRRLVDRILAAFHLAGKSSE